MSNIIMFSKDFNYHFYNQPMDMRKQFDGLCCAVRNKLDKSVSGKDVYIFVNQRRTHLKVLLEEEGGFTMFYRRLHEGQFTIPEADEKTRTIKMSATALLTLLKGLRHLPPANDSNYQQPNV